MSRNCELGRGLRTREKNATEGGAGRFEKTAPDARAAPPEAHEPLISRKTGAEVPLTGLSFPFLYAAPLHPYTHALFSAVPSVAPARRRGRIVLPGDVPNPANPPAGCRFHPRCPLAEAVCREIDPPATQVGDHVVHCHVAARELAASGPAAASTTIAAAISAPPADRSPHRPLPMG